MSSQINSKYLAIQAGNPALKLLDEKIVRGFLESYGNHRTKESYRHGLDQFRKWIAGLPDNHHPFNLLAQYRSYLQSRLEDKDGIKRLSVYSVALYMAVARKYARFLFESGLLEHNPADSVKGLKRQKTHYRRALDRHTEMPRLLATIDRTSNVGIRDYAIICLLAYTGIRGFELAAADYGDLDSVEGRPILWIRSKGKLAKSEYVFITDQPYRALMAYWEIRKGLNPQSPLFVTCQNGSDRRMSTRTVRERVDHWFKAAGLKSARITLHSLRHTAAISALKNGADIRAVQGMLRHADSATTLIYLSDIAREDKPAEDAVNYGSPENSCQNQENCQ